MKNCYYLSLHGHAALVTGAIRNLGKAIAFILLAAASWMVGNAIADDTPGSTLRPHIVWDDKPASKWWLGYPVGNGRLGAMPWGGYPEERILLNEEGLWQGRNSEQNDFDAMFVIEDARKLLFEGKMKDAHKLLSQKLLVKRIARRAYQPIGDLRFHYQADEGAKPKRFRRSLSMNEAVARTEFETPDGNRITQEVISSYPDDVIAIRVESAKPGGLSLTMGMDRFAHFETKALDDRTLLIEGQAQEDDGSQRGSRWKCVARVFAEGGSTKKDDNTIEVSEADAMTVLLAAVTDYNARRPFIPLRHDLLQTCLDTIGKAQGSSFAQIKSRNIADHQRYFNRTTVELGTSSPAVLKQPTRVRREAFKKGDPNDPDLIEDLFQMGRYLLIGSSRQGTLPANLRGIWSGDRVPNANSDWHLNINAQQNYQHAELTNLSELHLPFITLIDDLRLGQGRALAEKLGCNGFLATHATHGWKEVAFSGSLWWGLWPMGGAWSCGHVMEHYRFTEDKDYLAKTGYPILKDNVAFLLDWLVEHPETGKLVSGPSGSPENGFHIDGDDTTYHVCMGPTCDQMISYESFTDFLEASAALGIEDEMVARVRAARDQLQRPRIASDGRIMEWDKEYRELDNQIAHRHYSHLYGLHPGCEITPETPELFEAARKSVAVRQTGGGTWHGWSRAWLLNLYARLLDAENAYGTIRYLLERNTLPNLMHTQDPVYFDGNGAGSAGIVEMLLQSQGPEHVVRLLPALPSAWPSGSFEGLCARGGFDLDLQWANRKPVKLSVLSKAGRPFRLRDSGEVNVLCEGAAVNVTRLENGDIEFPTTAGKRYEVTWQKP